MSSPHNGSAPKSDVILRPGASGDEVRKLQERLNRLGYHLDADGTYGPRTTAAVAHLQARSGLPVDGTAGPLTQTAITQHSDVQHTHLGEHWEREVRSAGHRYGGASHAPHEDAASTQAHHPQPEAKPDEGTAGAASSDRGHDATVAVGHGDAFGGADDPYSPHTDEDTLDHGDAVAHHDDVYSHAHHSEADAIASGDGHDDPLGSDDHHHDAASFSHDDAASFSHDDAASFSHDDAADLSHDDA